MIAARSWPLFVITFAAAYTILYVAAIVYNLALFTYHPALEEFGLGVQPPREGPAMYWYGWLATAALGAFVIAAIAAALPESWLNRIWSGWSWLTPLAAMLVFCYLLRGYFLR
jgi:hypothetical protein